MTTSRTTTTTTEFTTSKVLGKRKASGRNKSLVLHLSSDAGSSYEESDSGPAKPSTSTPSIMMVNGVLVERPLKPYKCTFDGCEKSYTKPSRLEEHERSHTGSRPYVCKTCSKSYLRESHLQAHSRSHQPDSDKPFICELDGCNKRFWTTQHLLVHHKTHTGEKPFKCTESGCSESFSKNYQLRAHACTAHAPPGTKPYQCTHDDCSKSFTTNQKLRAHLEVHDERRYACVYTDCLPTGSQSRVYFGTWTALQHHIREAHPPTCPHPSCNGKSFTSHKGLRAHEKLHAQRLAEARIQEHNDSDAEDSDSESELMPPRKRRRGGEYGRDWKCEIEDCEKDFKSKKALDVHVKVTHHKRRDFVCPHAGCSMAYGYKHLLRRHLARVHSGPTASSSSSSSESEAEHNNSDIDAITGNAYAKQATERLQARTALRCPFPDLTALVEPQQAEDLPHHGGSTCDYVFSRAYDLRRHLMSGHNVEATKEMADRWVHREKARSK